MWVAKKRISTSYVCSIQDRTDPVLDIIRRTVKSANSSLTSRDYRYRVKLHGRRPIKKLPNYQLREIPLDFAGHIDVYIYREYN